MKINKITTGFVIQVFDTETGKYISQEFVAGEVDYEDKESQEVLSESQLDELAKNDNFGPYAEEEPYLPFDMVQPKA